MLTLFKKYPFTTGSLVFGALNAVKNNLFVDRHNNAEIDKWMVLSIIISMGMWLFVGYALDKFFKAVPQSQSEPERIPLLRK